MRVGLGIGMVLLLACGNKNKAPTEKGPQVTVAADAAVAPAPDLAAPKPAEPKLAPPDAGPTKAAAPRVKGFRVAVDQEQADKKLVASLPAPTFAPALAIPKTNPKAYLEARYELATGFAAKEPKKGIALLKQMLEATNCSLCGGVVVRSHVDDRWRSQWDTPLFHAAVGEASADHDHARGGKSWYERGNAGCPKGTRFKAKWTNRKEHEGRMWCQKRRGIKHGPYRWYETLCHMGEGSCSSEGTYRNGKAHGYWIESPHYYGGSNGHYRNGKKHGVWDESTKSAQVIAVYVNGALSGTIRAYYIEDGGRRQQRVTQYRAGKKHGAFREWETYTKPYSLAQEGTYHDDKEHGVWRRWDAEGRKLSIGHYERGVRHGTFTYWDASGKVLATTTMHKGDGDWVYYDVLRKLQDKGTIKNGLKQGPWIEGDLGSSEVSKGRYEKGKRVGPWQSKHSHGSWKGSYDKGVRTGAWTYHNSDGKPSASGQVVRGKPHGVWTVTSYEHKEVVDDDGNERWMTQKLRFRRGKLLSVNGKAPNRKQRKAWRRVRKDWLDSPDVLAPPERP